MCACWLISAECPIKKMKQERKYDTFMNPLVGASHQPLRETAALKMSCGEREHIRIKMNCTRHTLCAECQRTRIESSSQCCNIVIPAITCGDLTFTPLTTTPKTNCMKYFMPLQVMKSSQCCSFFDYVAHATSVGSVRRPAAIRRSYANYFVFSINHAVPFVQRKSVLRIIYHNIYVPILSLQTRVSLERQRKWGTKKWK